MKSVMLSIKPKWCELIANGKKTIEVRKTRPKIDMPFKCYIYETKGKTEIPVFIDEEGHEIYEGKGQVIGEFVCDTIYYFVQAGAGIMFDENFVLLPPQTARNTTCLTDDEIDNYLGDKDGYGWHISGLKIYDKPKELGEFKKIISICRMQDGFIFASQNCKKCKRCNLKRPPQSWCYVEELK